MASALSTAPPVVPPAAPPPKLIDLSLYRRRRQRPALDPAAASARLRASGLSAEQAACVHEVVRSRVAKAAESLRDRAFKKRRDGTDSLGLRVDAATDSGRLSSRARLETFSAELELMRAEFRSARARVATANLQEMTDEAAKYADETHAQEERLCELNGEYENMLAALRTELEASKHEQLRYTLGYVISCASFGVVCYRFLM